jgi:hypothetical protein
MSTQSAASVHCFHSINGSTIRQSKHVKRDEIGWNTIYFLEGHRIIMTMHTKWTNQVAEFRTRVNVTLYVHFHVY